MYVTIRQYEGVDVDAVKRMAEGRADDAGMAAIASEFPGFVAYFLVDTEDGGLLAISAYLGQAEADASTDAALQYVRENLSSIVPNPPRLMGGEVLAHRLHPSD
jgi:hypothetical protein